MTGNKDEILQIDLAGGQARMLLASSTNLVQECARIHGASPVATAALGRVLAAASMIGNMQKVDDGSITLIIKGGGPLGTLLATATFSARRGTKV